MANSTVVKMTGFVEYARIFTENMDDNMEFHGKTNGQFNMNFYPESETDFAAYFKAGAPESSMGHDAIKIGNSDLALGKFLKLKRPNEHPSGIEDFGGAPTVFDFTEGESVKKWSMSEQGELGNGTKVAVKVSIYGEGSRASIRLEKVAVLEHIKYEGDSDAGPAIKKDTF